LPASLRLDVRRLAREISGRLTGLALSSGAAKGFAHVGVIQVLEENGIGIDDAEFVGGYIVQAPQNLEASGFTRLDGEHQENREEEKIQTEQDRRNWRFEVRHDGEFLGDGRERESEAGAAFVAAGGGDTDEGAASGTEFWARRLIAAEDSAQGIFPALEARVPAIGKCQRASCD